MKCLKFRLKSSIWIGSESITPMNNQRLSDSLRFARESRRLSQKVVADKIGIPRSAISQIENGNRKVSTVELSKLAHLYQQSMQTLLDDGTNAESEDAMSVLQQFVPHLEQNEDLQIQLSECLNLCREGVGLRQLLEVKSPSGPPQYGVTESLSVKAAVLHAEEVAEHERRRIGFGYAPISDIADLIAHEGIWSTSVELPIEVSGFYMQRRDIGKVIFVNSAYSNSRKRFAYAHEYAHVLLCANSEINVSTTENAESIIGYCSSAFAASFLMPKVGVVELLHRLNRGYSVRHGQTIYDVAGGRCINYLNRTPSGTARVNYKDVATLAYHFGVSYQVAVLRLKNLRLVDSSDSSKLCDQEHLGREFLSELGMLDYLEGTDRQNRNELNLRREISHLAIDAYRDNRISRGRLLELAFLLGISGEVLLRLAESSGKS